MSGNFCLSFSPPLTLSLHPSLSLSVPHSYLGFYFDSLLACVQDVVFGFPVLLVRLCLAVLCSLICLVYLKSASSTARCRDLPQCRVLLLPSALHPPQSWWGFWSAGLSPAVSTHHVHLCSSSGLQACMSLPPACALMVQSKHLVWMPPHLHFSGYEPRQQADVAADVPLNVFGLLRVCLILLNWFGQTSSSPISTHCSVWRSEFPTGGGGGSDDLMSADPDLPRFSDLRSVLQSHGRIIGVFLLLYDGFQLTPHKQPTPTHLIPAGGEKTQNPLFMFSSLSFSLLFIHTHTHTFSHG